MRVVLDQHDCPVEAESVGEAIAAAADVAQDRGRVIIEIEVDGKAWSSSDLDSPSVASGSASEVRLTSAHPSALVGETLADAADTLAEVDRLQQSAAEQLQAGDTVGAMEQLQEAVSLWMSVQQAVVLGSQLAGLDLDSITVTMDAEDATSRVAVPRMIESLRDHLTAVRNALSSDDPMALADTLLYDLPPVIVQWRTALEELRRIVRTERAKP